MFLRPISLNNIRRFAFIAAVAAAMAALALGAWSSGSAEAAAQPELRVGERITYSVSMGRFSNVAFGELYTVSRGRLADRDAVELRARFKTLDFASAAFYLLDETRTAFADPVSLAPLYVELEDNTAAVPRLTIANYLTAPPAGFDLVTLIYKTRQAGGTGTFSLIDSGKQYPVIAHVVGAERIKTEAGEFDTSIASIESDYFANNGIRDVRLNLSADEHRMPVALRFKTSKGEFKALASSIQLIEQEIEKPPVAIQGPLPTPAPRPPATPLPYVNDQALASELAFDLGETLHYRVTAAGAPIGSFVVEAKERRQVDGRDTLLLRAQATGTEPNNTVFAVKDSITAQVNPDTLAPRWSEIRFTGPLSVYNQTAQFDPGTGAITFNGTSRVDAPIGTHTLLSLFYAVRSFNLRPGKDQKNPINDTRVAVFWENQPYIFTLRPSGTEIITVQGRRFAAQMVSINTQNTVLDRLNPRIWLGNDVHRLPLKIALGIYEAELVSSTAP